MAHGWTFKEVLCKGRKVKSLLTTLLADLPKLQICFRDRFGTAHWLCRMAFDKISFVGQLYMLS